jgi:hypothetical protein
MVIVGLLPNGDKIIGQSDDDDFVEIYDVLKIEHRDAGDKQFEVMFTPMLAPYSWDVTRLLIEDVLCIAIPLPAVEKIYRRVLSANEKKQTTEKVIQLVKP